MPSVELISHHGNEQPATPQLKVLNAGLSDPGGDSQAIPLRKITGCRPLIFLMPLRHTASREPEKDDIAHSSHGPQFRTYQNKLVYKYIQLRDNKLRLTNVARV